MNQKQEAENTQSSVVYQQSKMDNVYYDDTIAIEGDVCEVKIGNGEIVVSYETEDGFMMYQGKEKSKGHFELACQNNGGRASLHQFPKSDVLEGFWLESGEKGFWRIHLA